MQKSDFIPPTMAISAINALNGFAKDNIIAFIQLLVADGLVSEDVAMRKLATMDFGTITSKKRTQVAVPTSPSGYTDEYLNEVTGAVLRNIAGIHRIETIKQTGRQTKADMVACIKAHFEPTDALPKEKENPKEKKKEKKEKPKKKEDKESDDEELVEELVEEVPKPKKAEVPEPKKAEEVPEPKKAEKAEPKKKKEKEEKQKKEKTKKPKKNEEDESVEAELWLAPSGTTYLRDKDGNLYDKDTQEPVGTWDADSSEVIPA